MRIIVAVLALALSFTAARAECDAGYLQELLDRTAVQSPTMFEATPDGLKKLLIYINQNREKSGKEPVFADKFVIAYFKDGVGITLVLGKCLVPGMTFRGTYDVMKGVLEAAKMTPADLVTFRGGKES